MPRQNRVTPSGEIIATPERGTFWGNRGVLHDRNGRYIRIYGHRAWAICELDYKGRRRPLMAPGKFTELFFLDEVTALAAGHRPCGECRGPAFRSFKALWRDALADSTAAAPSIDDRLHEERIDDHGVRRTHRASLTSLPDGAVVEREGRPVLLWRGALWRWSPGGYRRSPDRVEGRVTVLTPPSTVAVLRAGYLPVVHPTVGHTGS